MQRKPQAHRLLALIFFSFFVLSGCAVQLAPLYQQSLLEQLSAANQETMELLAATSDGTDAASFALRDVRYQQVVGRLDATALQLAARPVPQNAVSEWLSKLGSSQFKPPPSGPLTPSVKALQRVSTTITTMRAVDKKRGVTALEGKAFRGQVVIYMDQALSYEAALQR